MDSYECGNAYTKDKRLLKSNAYTVKVSMTLPVLKDARM